jgi:hypothetical protein
MTGISSEKDNAITQTTTIEKAYPKHKRDLSKPILRVQSLHSSLVADFLKGHRRFIFSSS